LKYEIGCYCKKLSDPKADPCNSIQAKMPSSRMPSALVSLYAVSKRLRGIARSAATGRM